MKGILQPDKRTIIGPVTMEKPLCWDKYQPDNTPGLGLTKTGYYQCVAYADHLASLPSITAIGFEGHEPGEVSYVEDECSCPCGREVECILDKTTDLKNRCKFAIPSPQGEEQETKGLSSIEKINTIFEKLSGSNFFENDLLHTLVRNPNDIYAAKALFREGYWSCEKQQPNTHNLTTEQLVALCEAMIEHGIDIAKSLDAAEGTTTPDMKTYLNDKLNIDIP